MADRSARVLIADDDPFTRDVLRRFLGEKGFEVEVAVDGARALEVLSAFDPDVVLLDIRMPVMDGIQCLKQIMEQDRDCGVIMISGEADVDMARQTLELGAADFVYKPFDLDYLETSLLAKLLAMGKP